MPLSAPIHFTMISQNQKMNLNESTRQPINNAVRLRQKHTSTETDLNSDDLSALDKKSS